MYENFDYPVMVCGRVTVPYYTRYQILEETIGEFEVGVMEATEAEECIKSTLASFEKSLKTIRPRICGHMHNVGNNCMDVFGSIDYREESLTLYCTYVY